MEATTVICIKVGYLYAVLPAWAGLWALIGFSIGKYLQRPKRYILIEESGAWTHAKLHHVDERDVDAPTGSQETRQPEMPVQG
jgi:hypothetical protein